MEKYEGIRCWSCKSIVDTPTCMVPYQDGNKSRDINQDYGALTCSNKTCRQQGFVCLREDCLNSKLGSRQHFKDMMAVTNHRHKKHSVTEGRKKQKKLNLGNTEEEQKGYHAYNKISLAGMKDNGDQETIEMEDRDREDVNISLAATKNNGDQETMDTEDSYREDVDIITNKTDTAEEIREYSIIHENDLANAFYQHNMDNNKICGGVTYLVGKAVFRVDDPPVKKMHVNEVDIHLHTVKIMTELSISKRESLAELINKIVEETKRRMVYGSNNMANIHKGSSAIHTPLPTSYAKFARNAYFDGKHALVKNLPSPTIHELSGEDGRTCHTYMSLCEMLRCYFANGERAHNLASTWSGRSDTTCVTYPITTADESPRAKEVCSDIMKMDKNGDLEIIPLWEWSDDCEPNAVRQNKQSVWAKVVSVMPHIDQKSRFLCHNSFVIALGGKGGNHDLVEQRLHEELVLLGETGLKVWDRKTSREKLIYAKMLTSLKDQPERRGSNRLGQGNSKYHARWGWSFDLKSNWRLLAACDTCYENNMKHIGWERSTSICNNCTYWDMETPAAAKKFETEVDVVNLSLFSNLLVRKYFYSPPTRKGTKKVWYHRPFPVDYKCLTQFSNEVFDLRKKKKLSNKQVKEFLNMLTINDDVANEICENAENNLCLAAAKKRGDKELYDELEFTKENKPHRFECPIPALWKRNSIPLSAHIDVPMHLLFLGIVRSVAHQIQLYMVSCRRGESFLRSVKGRLEKLQVLQLEWCRAAPYKGGKFGGWISENYLCLARVATWFYMDTQAKGEDTEDSYNDPAPDIPISSYKVKQCKQWLKARSISYNKKARLNELRDIVTDCIQKNGGTRPPLKKKQQPNIVLVHNTIMALTCLISECMQATVTEDTVNRVDKFVKLFLSAYHRLDQHVNPNNYGADPRTKPSWVSSYNFICLLNLPMVIQHHGPLRVNWEGYDKGEAALRIVKPELKHGLKGNWMVSAHKRITNKTMLNLLWRETNSAGKVVLAEESHFVSRGEEEETIPAIRQLWKYYRYKSNKHIQIVFANNDPISFVGFGKDVSLFGIAVRTGRQSHMFVELCMTATPRTTEFGMHIFHLEANVTKQLCEVETAVPFYYCLGLSCGNSLYTIITSEWDVGDCKTDKIRFRPPSESIYTYWQAQVDPIADPQMVVKKTLTYDRCEVIEESGHECIEYSLSDAAFIPCEHEKDNQVEDVGSVEYFCEKDNECDESDNSEELVYDVSIAGYSSSEQEDYND